MNRSTEAFLQVPQLQHIKLSEHGLVCCPYGQPGDRLWVRETFVQGFVQTGDGLGQYDDEGNHKPMNTWYRTTEPDLHWINDDEDEVNVPWKPSIHMPRALSRILLGIVSVRVERLQDISEADAIAEGVTMTRYGCHEHRYPDAPCITAKQGYQALWKSINGGGSWEANPWVWAVEIKRIES